VKIVDRMLTWPMIAATSVVGGLVAGMVQHIVEPEEVQAPPAIVITELPPPASYEVTAMSPGPEPGGNVTPLPYWNWLIPTGKICFEVRGSTYATQAALEITANTDADILPARSNCLGYARTNVIKLVPKDMGTSTCAATSGTAYVPTTKRTVRGYLIYVLADPTIWYNSNPALLKSCFGSSFAARHVYGHELLHALGMKHNWGIASLVAAKPSASSGLTDYSWKYATTTAWDRAEVNRRY